MALELVDQIHPRDLHRENGPITNVDLMVAPGGDVPGVSLRKLANEGYTFLTMVPGSLTMATGLTFKLPVVDDGTNSLDLGKVIRLGVTVRRIVSGADETDLDANAATEATVDVTLDATTGQVVLGSLAITSLDSLAVGELFAVRVRRIGTHANDTCPGRALLLGVHIFNT